MIWSALLLPLWLLVAGAQEPQLAIVALPPPVEGAGRVQVVVPDAALNQQIAGDPVKTFRAVPGQGRAEVRGATRISDTAEASHTVITFDQSGSFRRFWGPSMDAAKIITDALPAGAQDRIEVLTFGTSMVDWGTADSAADAAAILQRARAAGAFQGSTRLRSFIRDAVRRAADGQPANRGGVRQVVVFTDAGEESSTYSAQDVIDLAQRLGVRVHMVVFPLAGVTAAQRLDDVKRIAEATGGTYLQVPSGQRPDADQLERMAKVRDHTWWIDLGFCGLSANGADRVDDDLKVEAWGSNRLAASERYPFRQHIAGNATESCPSDAQDGPGADVVSGPGGGWGSWWWVIPVCTLASAALLGIAFMLPLLLSLWRRPAQTQAAARPAPLPPPAQPPPVAAPPRPLQPPEPFAPVDTTDPLARLPNVRLVLVEGPSHLPNDVRLRKQRNTLGGLPDGDVFLDVPQVSGKHARIELRPGGGITLRDLGSTNGTFLDGFALPRDGQRPVKPGQRIGLSKHVIYEIVLGAGEVERAAPRPQAPPPSVPPQSPVPEPSSPEGPARTVIAPLQPKDKG